MRIRDVFDLGVARSRSTDDYQPGEVPFVTNTELGNGIVAYVEPFEEDKVFSGPSICVSGLGHATVHYGTFLPKGNGGDSCTILSPKEEMTSTQLIYYAALFNVAHKWRFSFGRKASKRRLQDLKLSPLHRKAPLNLTDEIHKNNRMMAKLLKENERKFSI